VHSFSSEIEIYECDRYSEPRAIFQFYSLTFHRSHGRSSMVMTGWVALLYASRRAATGNPDVPEPISCILGTRTCSRDRTGLFSHSVGAEVRPAQGDPHPLCTRGNCCSPQNEPGRLVAGMSGQLVPVLRGNHFAAGGAASSFSPPVSSRRRPESGFPELSWSRRAGRAEVVCLLPSRHRCRYLVCCLGRDASRASASGLSSQTQA
jgi:hypothetical protein